MRAGKQTKALALLDHEVSGKKMGCEEKLQQDAVAGCTSSKVETAGGRRRRVRVGDRPSEKL